MAITRGDRSTVIRSTARPRPPPPLQPPCTPITSTGEGEGQLYLFNYEGVCNRTWTIKDNLFHGAFNSGASDGGYLHDDYNGFITGTTNGLGGGHCRTGLTAELVSGPLPGDYSYPISGNSLKAALVGNGSRSAVDAELHHYTTTGDQTKEGNTQVDIGFHYAAAGEDEAPLDSDGDGIPDYAEDASGNGLLSNSSASAS